MTGNTTPSLIDRQIEAARADRARAMAAVKESKRRERQLLHAKSLGVVVPFVPDGATAKQAAVLAYVAAHYPLGLPASRSREDLCNWLSLEIDYGSGEDVSAKTVLRTLSEYGLLPEFK